MTDDDKLAPVCALCKCAIPVPTHWYLCPGCGEYICPDHPNIFGRDEEHDLEEHEDA